MSWLCHLNVQSWGRSVVGGGTMAFVTTRGGSLHRDMQRELVVLLGHPMDVISKGVEGAVVQQRGNMS
jgi:hypothetical protein